MMKQEMKKLNKESLVSLFLQQSYLDAQADYERAKNDPLFPHFDLIVLTASNEHQAEVFRAQLRQRVLPAQTEFVVIPDPNGERVGSGGATLAVIRYIKETYGGFSGRRVAVLHSGGDGKRTPNYSAMGKLFSPVPRLLPDGRPSSLFDECMISIASLPGRFREGMLVMSGDVLLLFNPLQVDFSGSGAAAISFKERVETAVNHGVYLAGENGNVARFLHKQSAETLQACGAVNAQGHVSIDTGAVLLAPDLLEALYSLVSTPSGVNAFIHPDTRLSFYADFLYPLAEDSTLEAFYQEAPEGVLNDALRSARTVLWKTLRPYRLKLLHLSPARFVHFGTTREIMALMQGGWRAFQLQGWNDQIHSCVSGDVAAYNSVVSSGAQIGAGCYLECSYLHHRSVVGNGCLLSCVDIHDEMVPDHVALHCLKQTDGRFVCRIYGIDDNPKQDRIFGIPLSETGLTEADSLWEAALYPICESVPQAVDAALNLHRLLVTGDGDAALWRSAEKASMRSGFHNADPQALIDWFRRMDDLVRMFRIEQLIDDGRPAAEAEGVLSGDSLSTVQKRWLEKKIADFDFHDASQFAKAIRLHRFTDAALNQQSEQKTWFSMISDTVLRSSLETLRFNDRLQIARDCFCVRLPLRVNWGGGWTDTPPYCIENGGTVLNCAILLDGQYPVSVTINRIPAHKIVLVSRDLNAFGEFETIEPLQQFGDPYDPFALQKACLAACGVLPKESGNLSAILSRIGGGFEMHSEVTNVPKGSGLGTSSILSAACVKAVFDFFGVAYTQDTLYHHVLAMEQIMSTGGGWQDQVGGLTPGVKLITSEPGVMQKVRVEPVALSEKTKTELNERFCLIYTGQRRLARNLLRDVISRYVGNEPESVQAHRAIRQLAVDMKDALVRGDVDDFAAMMNTHLAFSNQINPESTNTLIDLIFNAVDDLIDGRFVCGAGGGGFLQVILKRGVQREALHARLKSVFQDFPVDVWNSALLFD